MGEETIFGNIGVFILSKAFSLLDIIFSKKHKALYIMIIVCCSAMNNVINFCKNDTWSVFI